MKMTKHIDRTALVAVMLAGALLSLPQTSLAASGRGAIAQSLPDNPAASEVAARLNKKQFHHVTVNVDNGVATLSGTVDEYEYKNDADKIAHKTKGVTAVRNLITVAGPNVSDAELKSKLAEKLTYDRVGYGNTFNSISIDVKDGVVTLGGHARTDMDKDSALSLVSTYPGVKDVNNEVEVDPVSIMDDQTRIAVARAVYGFPALQKYAIDPAKTIRISVQNGHVELYGVVDSQADKEMAYMRANGVSGVFSVKNYLQVANQTPENQKPGGGQ
jgi:hyperosmotically inducible protein